MADIEQSRRGLEVVIASSTGRLYVIESTTGRLLDNYPLSLPAAIHTQVHLSTVLLSSSSVMSLQLHTMSL